MADGRRILGRQNGPRRTDERAIARDDAFRAHEPMTVSRGARGLAPGSAVGSGVNSPSATSQVREGFALQAPSGRGVGFRRTARDDTARIEFPRVPGQRRTRVLASRAASAHAVTMVVGAHALEIPLGGRSAGRARLPLPDLAWRRAPVNPSHRAPGAAAS